MNLEVSIAAVRDALLADERVSAAILFGSAAKGVARASSDRDLALVARSAQDTAGIDAQYLDLVGRLTRAAGRDVHLVLLDRLHQCFGRYAV